MLNRFSNSIMLKSFDKLFFAAMFSLGLVSCGSDPNDTGTEFAPNMYHSVGYEPMTQIAGDTNTINPYGMNMRLPVKGTVARNKFKGADSLKEAFFNPRFDFQSNSCR